MTTKHTHQMVYGLREPGCPRCAELAAGALPVRWNIRRNDDERRAVDVRAHFQSERHMSGGCGPVCTFGEY